MAVFAPIARPMVRTAMKVKAGDFASIRIAYRKSAIIFLSSVAERDHRVGFSCAQRGDVACEERDRDEGEGYSGESHRIEGADVKKHRAQSAAAHDSQDQAGRGADEHELGRPAD